MSKVMLKISKDVAAYLLLNDLASRYMITPEEAEAGLKILQRNDGSYRLNNGDKIEYHNRSWQIVRK